MKTRRVLMGALAASMTLPASQASLAQGAELQEVVVTARKREENIFEIPVSVSALSQDQLDQAGISNPEDLSAYVAGLRYEGSTSSGGRVNPDIRIRGLAQQIITPSTQVGALFWDGSYVGGGGGFLPFTDVERVEVIKGPQTAQFGRNTFSGAVNIIPKLPGDTWEGKVGLDYSPSQNAEYKADVAVGGPITDKIGVRVYVGYQRSGGDFKTGDGEPYAVFKDKRFSGTLVAKPTDKLTLKLSGYYVRADDNGTSMGIDGGQFGDPPRTCNRVYTGEYLNPVSRVRTPFTVNLNTLPFAVFCDKFPDGEHVVAPLTLRPTAAQSFGGAARLLALTEINPLLARYDIIRKPGGELGGRNQTWRLQFGGDYDIVDHTLSFQASQANTGTTDIRDFNFGVPTTPGTVFVGGGLIALREKYYEARIASPQDQRFRYMLGYSDYKMFYRQGDAPVSATQVATGAGTTVDFQDNTTKGVFGSVDYDITEAWTASAELRYTQEQSKILIQGNPGLPCGGFSPQCNSVNKYNDTIPRVILSYKPFAGATTYVSYSYSSLLGVATQAGFVNSVAPTIIPANQLAALGEFTKPQENTQYEIGWKQRGSNYSFTVAVFVVDWKNQPFASVILLPAGGTTSYRGPGDSKYKGFDLEYSYLPTKWLDVRGTLAYTDAIMTNFSSRGSLESAVLNSGPLSVVSDGKFARNVPAWTASLSPTIFGTLGNREWSVRTDVLYHGKTWTDYSEFNRAPAQTLINMQAGVDLNKGTRVEIYGNNLGDNKTLSLNGGTTTGPNNNRKVFTEPYQRREFGVRATIKF